MSEPLPRTARLLVALGAGLVPRERRAAWRRQWHADLISQASFLLARGAARRPAARDLVRRSAGAPRHALVLRVRHWRSMMLLQDFRHALRGLAQRPGFTAAIVLTLGLAIGANATIFSWIDALVMNPLPRVPNASELVIVRFATPTRNDLNLSYPNYRDIRDARPAGIAGIAVYDLLPVSLRTDAAPERIWAELVSGNIFDVLQVPAAIGRTLQPSDEAGIGQSFVAVISDRLWRARFNASPDVIGRPVTINGHPFTLVGVTPEGFRGPMNGLAADVWVPVTMQGVLTGRSSLESRGSGWLQGIARLSPGAAPETAAASLRAIAANMVEAGLIDEQRTLRVGSLSEDGAAEVLLPVVQIVMALVALVLLIACANVSGLLVARAVARRQEITIRAALGASRGRLIRQVLTESFVLAAAGGLAGVAIALWTSRGLDALLPPLPFPVLIGASVSPRVLLFSAGIVIVATLLFGLLPALQGSRPDLQNTLRARGTAGFGRAWLRRALVVSQVALAMVLLIAAGLFARTLANSYDVDPGFNRRDAVLASFDLSSLNYDEARGVQFFDELRRRLTALPGVEAAGLGTIMPLNVGGSSDTSPIIDGYTPGENEDVVVYYGSVSPGYFETLGVPIVAGRAIDERDSADGALAVVINETMAERYWRGRDPIGGRLRVGPEWRTVVGVAKAGKYGSLVESALSVMYFPLAQTYRSNPVLQVATRGPAAPVMDDVRRTVNELAPDLAVYDVRTLEEHMQMSVAVPRMAALVLSIFGFLALALAGVGLYGLIAFIVGQRRQEIGVRMALGADRGDILRGVVLQGAKLALAGLVAGAVLAVLAMPAMAAMLVGVSPTDAATFGATAGVLFAVALAAAWIPARRAAGLNPVEALRAD